MEHSVLSIFTSLWAVVNLNSNRTCPVCTGLPDNSMYWPDPMRLITTWMTIFCTVHRPNQTNIQQGSIFLAKSCRRANYDNSHGAFGLFTVPGLILGLFDRPPWLSPPWLSLLFSKSKMWISYVYIKRLKIAKSSLPEFF